jgi:hypothetical protein
VGFEIEVYDHTNLQSLPIAGVGANIQSYWNTGLSAWTEYTYRIYTYNYSGNSGYSNMAFATTPGTRVATWSIQTIDSAGNIGGYLNSHRCKQLSSYYL